MIFSFIMPIGVVFGTNTSIIGKAMACGTPWGLLLFYMYYQARPEVRKYVALYTEEQRKVLSIRPGITDYASIEYIDENRLLAQSTDPDKTYIEDIMPAKIALNMRYINHPTIGEYLKIIFLTFYKIIQ